MRSRLIVILGLLAAIPAARAAEPDAPALLLVVGAVGEPEYGSNFVQQVELWDRTCDRAEARVVRIGLDETNELTDHERLQQAIRLEVTNGTSPLWLVLVGHGTFDGKEARFNLRGPDVSASELADWLKPCRRPLVVINCASASAPFLKALAGTNRVVISATRSGNELNFARFGEQFARALDDAASDLDQDGQISVLETFLMASSRVAEFYQTEGRLRTEHALIDDNGDGLGTPADWFRGVRAIKKARDGAASDGARANQICLHLSQEELAMSPEARAQRDALELEVVELRESKSKMSEADYYRKLESLFLELARLQAGTPATSSATAKPVPGNPVPPR